MTIADVLNIPANWVSSVKIKRAWKTGIQASVNGTEKRSCLFSRPRRTLDFSILTVSTAETNNLKMRLFSNLHNTWGVPVWPDRTHLTSAVVATGTAVSVVSTVGRCFEVGGDCVILNDVGFEICEVAAVADAEITLAEGVEFSWDAGTEIYPLIPARLDEEQKISKITNAIGKMAILATEAVDTALPAFSATTGAGTYLTVPVFTFEPNWVDPVDVSLWHPYDVLQYWGRGYARSDLAETRFKISAQYLSPTRETLESVIQFFDVCKGRWGRFFMPTWQNDLVITEAFAADATELTVEENNNFSIFESTTTTGHHLFIMFPDGTYAIRRITGATDETHITIDEAIGTACTASGLPAVKVSFLLLMRFAQDELEVEYVTETVSKFNLNFVSLVEAV